MKLLDQINFDDKGLVPAIIVDAKNGKVLTLCYMNAESLRATLESGRIHVFRRSKQRVMLKGESSGHTQTVKELFVDCADNSLLFKVEQEVAACHAGYFTCYFRRYNPDGDEFEITEEKLFDPKSVY